MEQDDDDFIQDNEDELRLNLAGPFRKSLIQIIREVSHWYQFWGEASMSSFQDDILDSEEI